MSVRDYIVSEYTGAGARAAQRVQQGAASGYPKVIPVVGASVDVKWHYRKLRLTPQRLPGPLGSLGTAVCRAGGRFGCIVGDTYEAGGNEFGRPPPSEWRV